MKEWNECYNITKCGRRWREEKGGKVKKDERRKVERRERGKEKLRGRVR